MPRRNTWALTKSQRIIRALLVTAAMVLFFTALHLIPHLEEVLGR